MYRTDDNCVMRETDGALFEYPFEHDGVRYWADAASKDAGYTRHVPTDTIFVMQTKNDVWTVKRTKKGMVDHCGECVSESELAEPAPKTHKVAFELRTYEVSQAALDVRAMRLPDGRAVALFLTPNGSLLAAGVLPTEATPPGAPEAKQIGGAELARVEPQALSVTPTPTVARFTRTAEQAEEEAAGAPVLNAPIIFVLPAVEEETSDGVKIKRSVVHGIVMARVEVPAGFGSKPKRGEGSRHAYFLYVTAPGAWGSARDTDAFPIQPGTVAWVDEKSDLTALQRLVPRTRLIRDAETVLFALTKQLRLLGQGEVAERNAIQLADPNVDLAPYPPAVRDLVHELRAAYAGYEGIEVPIRFTAVRVRYLKKVPFAAKDGSGETHYAWRIEVRSVRHYTAPDDLRDLSAIPLPELPTAEELSAVAPEEEAAGEKTS